MSVDFDALQTKATDLEEEVLRFDRKY